VRSRTRSGCDSRRSSRRWTRCKCRTGLCAVPPASIEGAIEIATAPNDHFTAGPDGCVIQSLRRRVDGAGSCPTVGDGIISSTGTRNWRGWTRNGSWSWSWRAGWCPVSLASVQKAEAIITAPDDHFTAGPDCRVELACSGGIVGAGGYPIIRARRISPPGVQIGETSIRFSAPDDHFATRPDCGVSYPASWNVGRASGRPAIKNGIVPTSGVQPMAVTIDHISTPDDHFTAGPDGRVR